MQLSGRHMTEEKPIPDASQKPADDPATQKILEQRNADEKKKFKAEKNIPPGVTRNGP
jgi:hypothetical protein